MGGGRASPDTPVQIHHSPNLTTQILHELQDTMMPTPTSKTTQNMVIAVVLMACFVAIFYMYYEPTTSWFKCPAAHVETINISREMCHSFLRIENFTQIDSNYITTTLPTTTTPSTTITPPNTTTPPTTTTPKPLTTAKKDPEIIMLIWMWPFGSSFGLGPCTAYNIHGCRLTDDKNLYDQAHGVMFHHRDIRGDLSNMPQQPRPAFQKWVWWNMESPTNSGNYPQLKDLFNLTSNYRRDSDIPVTYGSLVEATEKEKKYIIPQKEKLVCWIVSNYNPNYRRSQYYNELSQYMTVDAYGRHFNRYINYDEYAQKVASCKFYLSFENSIHKDYMTEKLYNPLSLGTVPVVLGPPRENYEQFVPGDAFIHVDDFKSPKELAKYLTHLDQNEDLYKKYFTWREHFVAKGGAFGLEHTCMACEHIRRFKNYRVVKDLNSWYFS